MAHTLRIYEQTIWKVLKTNKKEPCVKTQMVLFLQQMLIYGVIYIAVDRSYKTVYVLNFRHSFRCSQKYIPWYAIPLLRLKAPWESEEWNFHLET